MAHTMILEVEADLDAWMVVESEQLVLVPLRKEAWLVDPLSVLDLELLQQLHVTKPLLSFNNLK